MSTTTPSSDVRDRGQAYDVVIVGAGFAGLYAVHKYRDQLGLRVRALEKAPDVGGTWFWNQYPGARCDIESIHYSYSFSEELQQEWTWSEKFAAQPEILAYLNHVADRFDLRRDIQLDTEVISVEWQEVDDEWSLETVGGSTFRARFVVSATGILSVPKKPDFPGVEQFQGDVLMTSNYREPYDYSGKRVGIIGTGSSGIQAIPRIAAQAEHLFVFQRTPNFATPMGNRSLTADEQREVKQHYREIREASRNDFVGWPGNPPLPSALAVSAEERRRVYDEQLGKGGLRLVLAFGDLLVDKKANDTLADYIRDHIRSRVADPRVAELLLPTDHPFGTKRPPLETDYFETFNRDNVTLVDVKSAPIEHITADGLVSGSKKYHFDVLVLALGFDAWTGPLLGMNIVGRDGIALADAWADGPRTHLGVAVRGFPNFFMVSGPQSPSALYNMPLSIEDHVDLIGDIITHLNATGRRTIEPTENAQHGWGELTNAIAEATLLPQSNSSWYLGDNIPGKPRRVLIFLGGAPLYREKVAEEVDAGYPGFEFDRAAPAALAPSFATSAREA